MLAPGIEKLTKDPSVTQLKIIRALAACGAPQSVIADYFGVSRRSFSQLVGKNTEIQREYRAGLAEVKQKILEKAIEKATADKGDTVMLIFLSKALCGLSDKGDNDDSIADKAAAIRDTLDQMNSGLDRFATKTGEFDEKKGKEK